jgi:Ser/Thr protein kinase RdoA (MazF antagonist)
MKEFKSLTTRGKIQRYRRGLVDALGAYPLKIDSVSFVSYESRPVFRIKADQGIFAAKFYIPSEHDYSQLKGEVQFLKHISEHSALTVETPFPNLEGEYITELDSRWLPETARFVLVSWVPGRQLADLSTRSYHYLGTCVAELYKASASFKPSSEFNILRNDRVFYWDEEVILSKKDPDLLPPNRQERFRIGVSISQQAIEQAWQASSPIVIHNDPHPCNLKIHQGKLSMYDFEDIALGRPEQDIGTAMYHVRFRDDFSVFYDSFRKGYEAIQPWPIESDELLDAFIMARLLMFANYVINYDINPALNLIEFESELEVILS